MLIDALHAPLEDAEIAFDGVRMDRVVPVFARPVVDEIVSGKLGSKPLILAGLIRIDLRLDGNVLFQDRSERLGLEVVHDDGLGAAGAAVHQ